jgi:hypothetical protein
MSTRTPSVRADARRRYVAVANAQAPVADTFAVVPAPSLTARVRTLYEDTIVPVAEIARLAGVTECTIYKYARKLGWWPRVVRLARGAGGRFIPLADVGQPVATGLKALDPQGAARAVARCADAALISERAAAAAAAAARKRAARERAAKAAAQRERVLAHVDRAIAQLAKLRAEAKGEHRDLLALAARLEHSLAVHLERLLG